MSEEVEMVSLEVPLSLIQDCERIAHLTDGTVEDLITDTLVQRIELAKEALRNQILDELGYNGKIKLTVLDWHNKIALIKVYRQISGLGLKESKEAIDKAAASASNDIFIESTATKMDIDHIKQRMDYGRVFTISNIGTPTQIARVRMKYKIEDMSEYIGENNEA